ncbi:hypothetical protein [Halomonas sp.]|uniref:hypothetical protein n=1 Tax=Halomonas sp. TaxID=1486246 RepID=UPI0025C2C653|nr:hypothetical protein [Halomonas sp.]
MAVSNLLSWMADIHLDMAYFLLMIRTAYHKKCDPKKTPAILQILQKPGCVNLVVSGLRGKRLPPLHHTQKGLMSGSVVFVFIVKRAVDRVRLLARGGHRIGAVSEAELLGLIGARILCFPTLRSLRGW